jgi:hypothetical protein
MSATKLFVTATAARLLVTLLFFVSQLHGVDAASSSSASSIISRAAASGATTADDAFSTKITMYDNINANSVVLPAPSHPVIEDGVGGDISHLSKKSHQSIDSSSPTTSENRSSFRIVFSDVDGTLVHYPTTTTHNSKKNDDNNIKTTTSTLLHLPPSKTGSRGVISSQTLLLCHQLRHGIPIIGGGVEKKANQSNLVDDDIKEKLVGNGAPVVSVPLVLISGMRTSTLFKRLPYLPRSDAYVCESGGRIFYPRPFREYGKETLNQNDDDNHTADDGYVKDLVVRPISYPDMPSGYDEPFILVEDMDWREQMSHLDAAGTDGYDNTIEIEHRRGKLWDFARALINDNDDININNDSKCKYVIDADGYATAFRIRFRQNTTGGGNSFGMPSLPPIPDGLACSTNLGCVDIYPTMSGKRNCAEYLARKLFLWQKGETNESEERRSEEGSEDGSILKTHAYCLCDDDNDIEMALACRAAYLPSVTSESMRKLASSDDNSLIVVEDETCGIVESAATEAALRALMKELQSVQENR